MCSGGSAGRWVGPVLAAAYALAVIVVLPLVISLCVQSRLSRWSQAVLAAGVFVLLALPVSLWQIAQHILHYNKPSLQKHIIRILWMVPIYACNAFLGLLFPAHSIYMDSLRECYEAYVIYNFMKYLLNYLSEGRDLEATLETKPQVNHMFPLCCLTPWRMGRELVHMCRHGILQYTVVRPLSTVASVLCELCGVYGESEFSASVAFPYMLALNNLSQFVAMYCLVLFYRANSHELAPMRPVAKFLCIKAVVFFSFFQGVLINILVYFGVISSVFGTSDEKQTKILCSKLQDWLICIEMFLAAIAHHYSFSYLAFVSAHTERSSSCLGSLLSALDLSDVKRDISEHLGVVGSSVSRRLRGKTDYQLTRGSDEHEPLVCAVASSVPCPLQPSTSTDYGTVSHHQDC